MTPEQRRNAIDMRRRLNEIGKRGAEVLAEPDLPKNKKPVPSVTSNFRRIAVIVSASRDIHLEKVLAVDDNTRGVVRARWEAWWLYAGLCGVSYSRIARMVQADNTTVRYGILSYARLNKLPTPPEAGKEGAKAVYAKLFGREWEER